MKHNPTPDPARKQHPPRALLIGDFTLPEFQPVAHQISDVAETEVVEDCYAAHHWLQQSGTSPELMVVAHLWPGQHPHQALDQLQQSAPLTRILALAGSWCEGGTTNRDTLARDDTNLLAQLDGSLETRFYKIF